MIRLTTAVLVTAAATTLLCRPSLGQYRQGSGNALDADLTINGPGSNPAVNPPDFAARNMLVTGNVAGGRGFRGTVGYTAQYDFREATGSEDLYVERANSALSAPNLLGSGGSIDRLRFGQYLNEIEYRQSARAATLADFTNPAGAGVINERMTLDSAATASTSSAIYDSTIDAQLIGLIQDGQGQTIAATASSLMGVQLTPARQHVQLIGLSTYDMARTLQDVDQGLSTGRVGQPFSTSFRQLLSAAPVQGKLPDNRIEPVTTGAGPLPPVAPSYRQIMERVARGSAPAAPEAPQPQTLSELDRQLEALRQQLAGTAPPASTATPAPGTPGEGPGLTPLEPSAIEALAGPLRHSQYLEHLAAGSGTRFDELMATAEQRLRDGEYFWAESRFDRALRYTPGHPYATAGLGHARIGAGLYIPAAITLRRLMVANPEMIDVRFEAGLLPARPRLHQAVQRLGELVAGDSRDRELYGFLLAYIGHQLEDRDLVEQGLSAMAPDDKLQALLRAVWLAAESQ